MNHIGSDQEKLQALDKIITAASRERRQRLATYVRRYMSPLVIEELFADGKLGVLMREEKALEHATILISDVRGFTPQTLSSEQRGRNLRMVAELLENFFDDALETVYEYRGVMGEFSGDKFMAIFGMPEPRPDDAERAVCAAIEIYDNAMRLNRPLRMTRQHHLAFEIGIGLSTGGPIWIGDVGSDWRRELTMIGTTINLASRIEEVTKTDEFWQVPGENIVIMQETLDSLRPEIRQHLELSALPPRQLRGLGDEKFCLHKLVGHDQKSMPVLRGRIDTATQAVVNAIAQTIESVQEREESFRLELTLQDIGQAISSSLELDDILESIMDGVQEFLHATTASLLLIDEGTRRLRFRAVRPRDYLATLRSFEDNLRLGTGLVGYVAETGESLCLYDAHTDPRFYAQPDTKTGFQTHAVVCAAIRLDHKIIGVIEVIDEQEGKFTREDLQVLETIAAFAASAIRNARRHTEHAQASMISGINVVTSDVSAVLTRELEVVKACTGDLLEMLAACEATLRRDKESQPDAVAEKLAQINQCADGILETMRTARFPFTELVLEPVAVPELLDQCIEQVLGKDPKLPIQRKYTEVPEVTTDRAKLAAVFSRFIENAAAASRDDTETPLIFEVWQPESYFVRIGLPDTGPRLPAESRERLFRPRLREQNGGKTAELPNGDWDKAMWPSSLCVRNLGGMIFWDQPYAVDDRRAVIELPLSPDIQLPLENYFVEAEAEAGHSDGD